MALVLIPPDKFALRPCL